MTDQRNLLPKLALSVKLTGNKEMVFILLGEIRRVLLTTKF
jgi:hypothetical protein